MNITKTFLIIGDDTRQINTAKKLAESGIVYILSEKNFCKNLISIKNLKNIPKKIDCILLPISLSVNENLLTHPSITTEISIDMIKQIINEDTVILCGTTANELKKHFKNNLINYLDNEEFAILNAIPTAEAAVEIAMKNINYALFKSNVLITGSGRIAKVLAKILKGFESNITIAARNKNDLTWFNINGYKTANINNIQKYIADNNIIFNTIPSMIIDKNKLDVINSDTLIIDLASKPGGVDFNYAEYKGIKTIHALALPAKYSPVTAGEILAKATLDILKERSTASD